MKRSTRKPCTDLVAKRVRKYSAEIQRRTGSAKAVTIVICPFLALLVNGIESMLYG